MNKLAHKSPRWREVHLADVVDQESPICYGIVLPGDHVDDGVPVIKVKDIAQGGVRTTGLLQTSPDIDAKYKRSRLTGGDILLSIRGTVGRLGIVPDELTGANITQDTARIRISCSETRAYVYQVLQSDDLQTQIRDHVVGQAVKGINIRDVKRLKLLLPSERRAQRYIAELLTTQDTAIQKTEQLIAAKERRLHALYQKLFGLASHTRSGWQLCRLAELMLPRKEYASPSSVLPLYSLTIEDGVTPKTDRYDREFLVKDTGAKEYAMVHPGDVVFNPSNLRWGAIARSKVNQPVVVSPIYEVLAIREDKVNGALLGHVLTCPRQIRYFSTKTEGTLIERMAVKLDTFLRTEIYLPSDIAQQAAIAAPLDEADREISSLRKYTEALKIQKRGLMQKLLTGQWRLPLQEEAS